MIKLNSKFTLPKHLPTMKLGILGRTGSGKTNTAVVMAEQLIEQGCPVAIIDPQGDWWGLRSKYSIAILGGEHADIPLEPTGGSLAADFVINERIPVLLDLFTMGEGEMVRFATDFAKRLWTKNRDALHVFLDEADLFAPQKSPGADKAKCLGAWQNVCRRGRSRGLGLTMVSQRSAVVNKDLLTQADPMIVHRLTAPQDLAAIDSYLDFHGYDKSYRKQVTAGVSKLAVGESLILSPGEMEILPTTIKVSKRRSYDSGATPTAGKKRSAAPKKAEQRAKRRPQPTSNSKRPIQQTRQNRNTSELPKGERVILTSLAQFGQCDRAQLTVLTGYKRSSRDTYIQRLREKGYVDASNGSVRATDGGLEALGDFEELPTGQELRDYWIGRLPPGEAAILSLLFSRHPSDISRDEISVETNYKRSSRDTYIQRLSAKKLVVVEHGGVRASDHLF